MALFLHEDNQNLNKEKYRLTKKGQETLNAAITKMEAMGLEKHDGYKMLKHLQDDEYNQSKKNDKNKVIKDPNIHTASDKVEKPQKGIPNKTVEGGIHRNKKSTDKITHAFTDWVYGTNGELQLKHKRNQNIDANKAKIPTPNKPKKMEEPKIDKPINLPNGQVHVIQEEFNSNEDYFSIQQNDNFDWEIFYERTEEYDTRYVLNCFLEGKNPWLPLINPYEYQQALNYFTKGLEIPQVLQKKIYQWMGIIMKNTAILQACTELCGHEMYIPTDDIIDTLLCPYDDDEQIEDYAISRDIDPNDKDSIAQNLLDEKDFYDWEHCHITDYGRKPLFNIISHYNDNLSPEQVLVIINKALDAYHHQGDLSFLFIEGGKQTLNKITNSTLSENICKILTKKDFEKMLN